MLSSGSDMPVRRKRSNASDGTMLGEKREVVASASLAMGLPAPNPVLDPPNLAHAILTSSLPRRETASCDTNQRVRRPRSDDNCQNPKCSTVFSLGFGDLLQERRWR